MQTLSLIGSVLKTFDQLCSFTKNETQWNPHGRKETKIHIQLFAIPVVMKENRIKY